MSQLNVGSLQLLQSSYWELNHLSHFEFSGRRNEGDVTASLDYSKHLGKMPGKVITDDLPQPPTSFTLGVN